jgi:hypothetical protein
MVKKNLAQYLDRDSNQAPAKHKSKAFLLHQSARSSNGDDEIGRRVYSGNAFRNLPPSFQNTED